MTTQTVRWHPRGEPVPPGWRKVSNAPAHHGQYSILISPQRRKVGRTHLLDGMPLGWFSAQKLADRMGRERGATRCLLRHALKKGWVERRKVECRCCASSIFEYRRVK